MNDSADTKNGLPLALRSSYMALHRRTDAAMIEFGVTADQFVLLLALSEEEALIQRELADRISSDPSTVRAMLVLLERNGLVERSDHPTDSRAKTVALSAAGRRRLKKLWKAGQSIRDQMSQCMTPGEAQTFIELLQRVAHTLNQEKCLADT